jgi:hypothetical protein
MKDPLAALTGILVLATIAEAIVEHIFAPIVDAQDPAAEQPAPDDMEPEPARVLDWPALALRYVSVLIGVALCIVYRVDLLAYFNLISPWPIAGWIIIGLLIGRGSNFIHDFATRWLTKSPYD